MIFNTSIDCIISFASLKTKRSFSEQLPRQEPKEPVHQQLLRIFVAETAFSDKNRKIRSFKSSEDNPLPKCAENALCDPGRTDQVYEKLSCNWKNQKATRKSPGLKLLVPPVQLQTMRARRSEASASRAGSIGPSTTPADPRYRQCFQRTDPENPVSQHV